MNFGMKPMSGVFATLAGIKEIGIFLLGAMLGSAAAWSYAKDKYQAISDEEIESVKETYKKREADILAAREILKTATEKPDVKEYAASTVSKTGYTNYSESETPEDMEDDAEETPYGPPHVIPPEEFAYDDIYEKIGMVLYSDNVLVDEDDQVVTDADDIVGTEYPDYFGEYDDVVYVRNDRLKADYEISKDLRRYATIIRKHREEGDASDDK